MLFGTVHPHHSMVFARRHHNPYHTTPHGAHGAGGRYATHKDDLIDYYFAALSARMHALGKPMADFGLDQCKQRFQSGLVYNLMLEAIGQGTMSVGGVALAAARFARATVTATTEPSPAPLTISPRRPAVLPSTTHMTPIS